MALEIKLRAEFQYRSIEDELRFLLMMGITYEDRLAFNEKIDTNAHQFSLFGTQGNRERT
jgi:plasmid stability protein